MGRRPSRTFLKYLALQAPALILLSGVLLLLRPWVEMATWAIALILLLWLVKDLALYPVLRHAYEDDPRTGTERLIGERGVAATALAPQGYVRVQGELWQAEAHDSTRLVPEGRAVRIRAARGYVLAVDLD